LLCCSRKAKHRAAAPLQAADGGENPILIRIEKSAGHRAGKPVSKVVAEQTDLYTFFCVNLGVTC